MWRIYIKHVILNRFIQLKEFRWLGRMLRVTSECNPFIKSFSKCKIYSLSEVVIQYMFYSTEFFTCHYRAFCCATYHIYDITVRQIRWNLGVTSLAQILKPSTIPPLMVHMQSCDTVGTVTHTHTTLINILAVLRCNRESNCACRLESLCPSFYLPMRADNTRVIQKLSHPIFLGE